MYEIVKVRVQDTSGGNLEFKKDHGRISAFIEDSHGEDLFCVIQENGKVVKEFMFPLSNVRHTVTEKRRIHIDEVK